jgi:hypothetical protein
MKPEGRVVRLSGDASEIEIRGAVESLGPGSVEVFLGIEPSGRIVGVADRDRAEGALRSASPEARIIHLDIHARPVVVGVIAERE